MLPRKLVSIPSVGREWAGRGAGAWHLHLSDQHINHTHFPTSYVAAEAAWPPVCLPALLLPESK